MTKIHDVAIVGGGISGLSAAYFLQRCHPHLSTILIESRPRLGGWIQTITLPSGQTYEAGPRCLRLRGEAALATADLITSLHLEHEVIKASRDASSRYVILNGTPEILPKGPLDLFFSPIGRELAIKTMLEPFQGKGSADDESVASFFARRAPSPLVNRLANALTSGIWGGEASELSIYNTFPELKEDDLRYGSCLIGRCASIFQKKAKASIRGMCTFAGGLQRLVDAIAGALRMPVLIEHTIGSMDLSASPIALMSDKGSTIYAKKVLLALPEPSIRQLIPSFFGSVQPTPHASFVTVVMGWKEASLPRTGFGILAPSSEDPHVLGIVLDSCVFPQQNTHMKTRMTVILGGARWNDGILQSDETVLSIASSRVAAWTGVNTPCAEYRIIRSASAIPQPAVGSHRPAPYVLSSCGRIYALPSSIGGVSVNQCITSGYKAACDIWERP